MFCTKCGHECDDDALICENCGSRLDDNSPDNTAAPEQTRIIINLGDLFSKNIKKAPAPEKEMIYSDFERFIISTVGVLKLALGTIAGCAALTILITGRPLSLTAFGGIFAETGLGEFVSEEVFLIMLALRGFIDTVLGTLILINKRTAAVTAEVLYIISAVVFAVLMILSFRVIPESTGTVIYTAAALVFFIVMSVFMHRCQIAMGTVEQKKRLIRHGTQ